MQLDWLNLRSQAPWMLVVLLVLFILGVWALRRLGKKRRAQIADWGPKKQPKGPWVEVPAEEIALPRGAQPDAGPAADAAPQMPSPAAATAPAPLAGGLTARQSRDKDVLTAGLSRTKASFLGRIAQIFGSKTQIDETLLDAIEEVLLTADVGVGMAMQLMDELRAQHQQSALQDLDGVRRLLQSRMRSALRLSTAPALDETSAARVVQDPLDKATPRPKVVLFVGVNGVGKTTSIGKIAARLRDSGKSVLLAAGDTYRAAAAEQLSVWGERTGARVVRGAPGADPASVMFNAVQAAQTQGIDVVLADTAGRLHTKVDLMQEIKKVQRACSKVRPGAPDETWLVVDGTTGQNALQQAKEFHQALSLTGVILTKLDGTAKGGVVVAIVEALQIPVVYVGVGEKAEDLMPFDADQFVEALFAPAEAA